jgi:hypothetical protein
MDAQVSPSISMCNPLDQEVVFVLHANEAVTCKRFNILRFPRLHMLILVTVTCLTKNFTYSLACNVYATYLPLHFSATTAHVPVLHCKSTLTLPLCTGAKARQNSSDCGTERDETVNTVTANVPRSPILVTLMMEALSSSETLVRTRAT